MSSNVNRNVKQSFKKKKLNAIDGNIEIFLIFHIRIDREKSFKSAFRGRGGGFNVKKCAKNLKTNC